MTQSEWPTTSEVDQLKDAVMQFAHYFWVEMHWEHFRAEFLSNGDKNYATQRQMNAAAMTRMLDDIAGINPELRRLIMEGKKTT